MLVSTSHDFIFIHIAKNGGTTLRALLRDYSVAGRARSPWTDFVSSLPFRQAPENIAYPPHQNARWARRKLGADFYDNAFSFAFVRNPYDRAVSRYEFIRRASAHHQHRRFAKMSFADFITDERQRNLFLSRTQLSEVADRSGRIIVTKIYRIENYDAAVRDICTRIGIEAPNDLEVRNRTTDREHYRAYFTPELKNRFDRIYRDDLEAFSYEF